MFYNSARNQETRRRGERIHFFRPGEGTKTDFGKKQGMESHFALAREITDLFSKMVQGDNVPAEWGR